MKTIVSSPRILPFITFMFALSLSQTQEETLWFGLIADPQYAADKTSNYRCYDGSLAKMEEAVASFNAEELPFAVLLGDLIEGNPGGDGSTSLAELEAINNKFKEFTGDRYYVMGNHDLVDLNKEEWLEAVDPMIAENYYSFDRGPFHFVVLDGNYTSDGSDYGRDTKWGWKDTWIPQEQQDWLIDDLDSAGNQPTIVFVHQTLHDTGAHYVNNAPEIRNILETHGNVTHVFQGHAHNGDYKLVNGIHYVTIKAMVNCPNDVNYYAAATIRGDTIHVEGYGNHISYELPHDGLLDAVWSERGCTDPLYAEYNPDAAIHDQSMCKTPVVAVTPSAEETRSVRAMTTNSNLYIATSGIGEHVIKVFNVNGGLEFSVNGRGKKNYRVTGLSPGVYFIKVNALGYQAFVAR